MTAAALAIIAVCVALGVLEIAVGLRSLRRWAREMDAERREW